MKTENFRKGNLLIDLFEFFERFCVKVCNSLICLGKVVNNPLEAAFETLGGVLERKNCFEVEGTLENDFIRGHLIIFK